MNDGSRAAGIPEGTGGFFLGLVTGLVIGGAAVMLYAPKSGLEVRGMLKEEVTRTQDMLQSWADDLRIRANEISQIIQFRANPEPTVEGNGQKLHEL